MQSKQSYPLDDPRFYPSEGAMNDYQIGKIEGTLRMTVPSTQIIYTCTEKEKES